MRMMSMLASVLALMWLGCNQCKERNTTYAGEDVLPHVDRSVEDVVSWLTMERTTTAQWQVQSASQGEVVFPPVPFEGTEDLTFSIELPGGRFRLTSEYQAGDWDCADGSPTAEAVLHIESASGLIREQVPGTLRATGLYKFEGSVPKLEGEARSYDPTIPHGFERIMTFDVTVFQESTSSRVSVGIVARGDKDRMSQILLSNEE